MRTRTPYQALSLAALIALTGSGLAPAQAAEPLASHQASPAYEEPQNTEADNYMVSYDSHDDDQQPGVEYEVKPFYTYIGESEQIGLPSGVKAVLDFADPRLNARFDETTGSIFYRLDSTPTENTTYKLKVTWYFPDGSSLVIDGAVFYTLPRTFAESYEMRSNPNTLIKETQGDFPLPSFSFKSTTPGGIIGGTMLTYELLKQDDGITLSIGEDGWVSYSLTGTPRSEYSFTWRATAEDGSSLDVTSTLIYDPTQNSNAPGEFTSADYYTLRYTSDKYNQEVGVSYHHAPVFWGAGLVSTDQSQVPGTRYDLLSVSNPALKVTLDPSTGLMTTVFTEGKAGDRGWVLVRATYPDGSFSYEDVEVALGQKMPAHAYANQFKISYPAQPVIPVEAGQENRLALTAVYRNDPDSHMNETGLKALRAYLVDAPAELKARVDLESGDLLYTLDSLPAQDTLYPVTIKLVFQDGSSTLHQFDLLVKGQSQQQDDPAASPTPVATPSSVPAQPEASPAPQGQDPAPVASTEPGQTSETQAESKAGQQTQPLADSTSVDTPAQQTGQPLLPQGTWETYPAQTGHYSQQTSQAQLARTGLNATGIFATGLLLLVAGSALVLRRRRSA